MSTPVPRTGRHRWHRRSSKGVSANTRALSHRYADEGDKGKAFRRLVRRVESRLWQREAAEERDQ